MAWRPVSEPVRKIKVAPPSGTATVEDDQLNLLCTSRPWVVKNQVPGVGVKPVPVSVPVALIARNDPL